MALTKREVEQLTEKYYADVYKFAVSKLRDKENALDITQDTFLMLTQKASELEDTNILAWLICVCANKVKEFFRQNSAERDFISIEDIADDSDFSATCDFSDIDSVSDEMLDNVQKRILKLLTPSEQKDFIELFINKKNISIFAEESNLSEGAANTRKSRLKKKAKKLYRDTYFLCMVISFKYF